MKLGRKLIFILSLAVFSCLFVSVISDAQTTLAYYYGQAGNLVNTQDGNSTSSYLTRQIRYNGSETTFLVSNIKDVTALVNSTGDVQQKYNYSPYGTELNYTTNSGNQVNSETLSLSQNPFTYSRYYCDFESGFYYLKARYYDPQIGEFLSMDTYNLPNRYMYVSGNPVMGVDPLGHITIDFFGKFHITNDEGDRSIHIRGGHSNDNFHIINKFNKNDVLENKFIIKHTLIHGYAEVFKSYNSETKRAVFTRYHLDKVNESTKEKKEDIAKINQHANKSRNSLKNISTENIQNDLTIVSSDKTKIVLPKPHIETVGHNVREYYIGMVQEEKVYNNFNYQKYIKDSKGYVDITNKDMNNAYNEISNHWVRNIDYSAIGTNCFSYINDIVNKLQQKT